MSLLIKRPKSTNQSIKKTEKSSGQLSKIQKLEQLSKKYQPCNLLGLVDATGSMSPVWTSTKEHIDEVIRRVTKMGKFQMRWVAYRDYCDGQNIIETSSWTSEAAILLRFIESIICTGGGDAPEAVEKALSIAADDKKASRIILIGDAPPHAERDYRQQAARLAQLKRPVFSFVVGNDSETKRTFAEISQITGGVSTKLTSADELVDLVALTMIQEMGGKRSVEEYIRKYGPSDTARKYAALLPGK